MAQQKLYTEEQVIRAIELSDNRSTDEVVAGLTPIELPSDEEIGLIALNIASTLKDEEAFYLAGFQTCAKWMREQILKQNL